MIRKIVAVFFLVTGLLLLGTSIAGTVEGGRVEGIAFGLVFAAAGVFLFLKKPKKAAYGAKGSVIPSCKHVAGLPFAENTMCTLGFEDSQLVIQAPGTTVNLAYGKISDMRLQTETELQKHIVSSIGGAVGGSIIAGPIGAAIGGRAKERTTSQHTNFIMVTYLKEQDVQYICFQLMSPPKDAYHVIQRFAPMFTAEAVVNL